MEGSCIDLDTSSTGSLGKCRPLPPLMMAPLEQMASGASVVLVPTPDTSIVDGEARKLPSSQYKGVVPQPNGRWGAQIYERHQRVWLGTFGDEVEAARAYDVAVQRFRGRDAVTNFKPLSESNDHGAAELAFLSAHSKAEIVDMLRKHTYTDELEQGKRAHGGAGRAFVGRRTIPSYLVGAREILFDKVVTPSDVGKLNRLVIPKQQAEKHFPLKSGSSEECKGMLLNFEDPAGNVWRFRYSYWTSSQSYVLTKGWSRFVKQKGLKAGSVVSFWRSTGAERQLYIDWKKRAADHISCHTAMLPQITPIRARQSVRLFGVNISETPANCDNRKRSIEMDLFPQHFFRKQCIGILQ